MDHRPPPHAAMEESEDKLLLSTFLASRRKRLEVHRDATILEDAYQRTSKKRKKAVSTNTREIVMDVERLREEKLVIIQESFRLAAYTVIESSSQTQNKDSETDDEACILSQILNGIQRHKLKCIAQALQQNSPKQKKACATPTISPPPKATSLDSRATVARAILCAAGCLTFSFLTSEPAKDPLDIPQNALKHSSPKPKTSVNMGAVLMQAQTLSKRATSQASAHAARFRKRFEMARRCTLQRGMAKGVWRLSIPNPFGWGSCALEDYSPSSWGRDLPHYPIFNDELVVASALSKPGVDDEKALTTQWKSVCLPRLLGIVTNEGAGNAILLERVWDESRMLRFHDFLKALASVESNYGMHLIVCSSDDLSAWQEALPPLGFGLHNNNDHDKRVATLRTLSYTGSNRSTLYRHLFHLSSYNTRQASVHIVLTTYLVLIEDFALLCQISWQVVLLDDGFGWLGAAHSDANGLMGKAWDGIWNRRDFVVPSDERVVNVGLTTRHRILTSSGLTACYRGQVHPASVPGCINFLCPQFETVTREEWDRSRIHNDVASMKYFRSLLARMVVVHTDDDFQEDDEPVESKTTQQSQLARRAMEDSISSAGGFSFSCKKKAMDIPSEVLDQFIASGKLIQSRRFAISWLSPSLRADLLQASFSPILTTIAKTNQTGIGGFICEEIVVASSSNTPTPTTPPPSSDPFKPAVKCGRVFASEQGLRQHMAALHAPPGTWLCRSCATDCGTSQARTHHERYCSSAAGGAGSAVGQVGMAKQHGPGVGKQTHSALSQQNEVPPPEENTEASSEIDEDGSFRVPSYRGVWVNAAGKHFIKILNQIFPKEIRFFDSAEEAAKFHDKQISLKKLKQVELNYKKDGTRIVYEDTVPSSGLDLLGGSASSVVPALSVINIKDLPPNVKPLLRDPRQTSRTGGNSKRFVYKYRGVCRQARKGHDRWQSQISFGGTNHYLGTFDSEWDAAAIYAWAHLILYGEEATQKAQREGEEAYAEWEQQKKDIAAGKIVEPIKPPKKKKPKQTTAQTKKDVDKKTAGASHKNKGKTDPISSPCEKSSSLPSVYDDMNDADLLQTASTRIQNAKKRSLSTMSSAINTVSIPLPPIPSDTSLLLIGLSADDFDWEVDDFLASLFSESSSSASVDVAALHREYGIGGSNVDFRSVVRTMPFVIGKAPEGYERAYERLFRVELALGAEVGMGLDCHVGGPIGSCSAAAAQIQPDGDGFVFCALGDEDTVTVNGKRLVKEMEPRKLCNGDICGVGARVFVVLLPTYKSR